MLINFLINSKIVLLVSALSLIACNDAGFSGGSTVTPTKKPKSVPTPVKVEAPPPPKPVSPIPEAPSGAIQPSDAVDNSDGTRKEVFFGRSVVETVTDVDIIFAVDTSGSMKDEAASVQLNMSAFLSKLQGNKRLNYQVFLIGDKISIPGLDPKRFTIINQHVDSLDALVIVKNFFTSPPAGGLSLRPKATKEIVVVTDDDSKKFRAPDFLKYLSDSKSQLGTVHLNGFIWLPTSVKSATCTMANIGNEYLSIVANKEFAGELFDLCSTDWKLLFGKLADRIVNSSAQVEFALGARADPGVELAIFVNDAELDKAFWTYSETKNSIIFQPDHAPGDGDTLSVLYKIAK